MTGWDGVERREAVMLAEELRPKETVNAPLVMVLVGFAAMLLMQAAAIWAHGELLHNQRDNEARDQQFACYIVHTSQGEAPTVALTACGFLNLGGK